MHQAMLTRELMMDNTCGTVHENVFQVIYIEILIKFAGVIFTTGFILARENNVDLQYFLRGCLQETLENTDQRHIAVLVDQKFVISAMCGARKKKKMIFKINASFAKSQNVSTFETFILRKILKYLYGIFFCL